VHLRFFLIKESVTLKDRKRLQDVGKHLPKFLPTRISPKLVQTSWLNIVPYQQNDRFKF